MLTLVLVLLVTPLLIALLLANIRSSRQATLMKQFTGPRPWPIIGNFFLVSSLPPTTIDFFRKYTDLCLRYDSLSRAWFGPFPFLHLADTESLEVVLGSTKVLDKSFLYDFVHPWLGTGLLTSRGEKWRKHRKILTPSFHFKILEQFVETFERNSEILTQCLRPRVGQPEFDVNHYVTLSSLDSICESAMGVKVNAQKESESEYVKALRTVGSSIIRRGLSPWLYNDFLYGLTPLYREEKKALAILHGTTNRVISKRKIELQNEKSKINMEEDSVGSKRKVAFLDLLLQYSQEGVGLSDEDIREEVDTFMFEGHDTTAAAISFAIYCLAHHPDVQDKALKEQQDMFGNSERAATYQDLQDMKYLELVIKETLRMFPSVPLYGREVTEEFVLAGKTVPKGANFLLNAYALHRNPKFYPDPERFDTSRFLPEESRNRHPYLYVPFSAGPRNCIGQKFAMLELKSTLSKILRTYKVLPGSHSFEYIFDYLTMELILKSTIGIKVRLELRSEGGL